MGCRRRTCRCHKSCCCCGPGARKSGICHLLHFAAGNIAGAAGYVWSYNKHQDKKRAIITGVCTAFAAGVMKEMYDATFGGYVEHGDVLATTLGGITISATIPLFENKKRYGPKKYRKPKSKRKCGI